MNSRQPIICRTKPSIELIESFLSLATKIVLRITSNFWNHQRKLKASWYSGETGIEPLDDVIKKVGRYAYAHHIERLMVVGSLMLLLEVQPHEAHRWFMEMFIDSSDWVMGPNVYGMAIFSDGGIFATKPYFCYKVLVMGLIDELKWRGMLQDVMPGTDAQLEKEMTTGYIGFDPTADSLHIGSLVPILMLCHLQKFGQKSPLM